MKCLRLAWPLSMPARGYTLYLTTGSRLSVTFSRGLCSWNVHGDHPGTVREAVVVHFCRRCILLQEETKGHGTMVRGVV
jgi:hypothetical protein